MSRRRHLEAIEARNILLIINLLLIIVVAGLLVSGRNLARERATWHPPLEYPSHCPDYR